MTWLGILNFLLLQWFGFRLARVVMTTKDLSLPVGPVVKITIGWKLLRWVWPLTGWWSDYRWIHRVR